MSVSEVTVKQNTVLATFGRSGRPDGSRQIRLLCPLRLVGSGLA